MTVDMFQYDEARAELQRRDQDIMALTAKLKTQEEQQHDYQRHIAVLKESLCAKEEHYNMLQADVSKPPIADHYRLTHTCAITCS